MSVTLEIYSNHNLDFNNYFDGVDLFEKKLNIQIQDSLKVGKRIENNISNIVYYTNRIFFAERFRENKRLEIYTNYKNCNSILIYKNFIEFVISGDINLNYLLWQKSISKNNQFMEWQETINYIKEVMLSLGGDYMIFINDGSDFGTIKDSIIEGESFKNIIKQLKSISQPLSYNDLENDKIKIYDNENWYFQEIVEKK